MAAEKKAGKNKTAVKKQPAREEAASEINSARWSVVSFEKCVAKNLTYTAAAEKLTKLREQKISGLCIITDEAAARISN